MEDNLCEQQSPQQGVVRCAIDCSVDQAGSVLVQDTGPASSVASADSVAVSTPPRYEILSVDVPHIELLSVEEEVQLIEQQLPLELKVSETARQGRYDELLAIIEQQNNTLTDDTSTTPAGKAVTPGEVMDKMAADGRAQRYEVKQKRHVIEEVVLVDSEKCYETNSLKLTSSKPKRSSKSLDQTVVASVSPRRPQSLEVEVHATTLDLPPTQTTLPAVTSPNDSVTYVVNYDIASLKAKKRKSNDDQSQPASIAGHVTAKEPPPSDDVTVTYVVHHDLPNKKLKLSQRAEQECHVTLSVPLASAVPSSDVTDHPESVTYIVHHDVNKPLVTLEHPTGDVEVGVASNVPDQQSDVTATYIVHHEFKGRKIKEMQLKTGQQQLEGQVPADDIIVEPNRDITVTYVVQHDLELAQQKSDVTLALPASSDVIDAPSGDVTLPASRDVTVTYIAHHELKGKKVNKLKSEVVNEAARDVIAEPSGDVISSPSGDVTVTYVVHHDDGLQSQSDVTEVAQVSSDVAAAPRGDVTLPTGHDVTATYIVHHEFKGRKIKKKQLATGQQQVEGQVPADDVIVEPNRDVTVTYVVQHDLEFALQKSDVTATNSARSDVTVPAARDVTSDNTQTATYRVTYEVEAKNKKKSVEASAGDIGATGVEGEPTSLYLAIMQLAEHSEELKQSASSQSVTYITHHHLPALHTTSSPLPLPPAAAAAETQTTLNELSVEPVLIAPSFSQPAPAPTAAYGNSEVVTYVVNYDLASLTKPSRKSRKLLAASHDVTLQATSTNDVIAPPASDTISKTYVVHYDWTREQGKSKNVPVSVEIGGEATVGAKAGASGSQSVTYVVKYDWPNTGKPAEQLELPAMAPPTTPAVAVQVKTRDEEPPTDEEIIVQCPPTPPPSVEVSVEPPEVSAAEPARGHTVTYIVNYDKSMTSHPPPPTQHLEAPPTKKTSHVAVQDTQTECVTYIVHCDLPTKHHSKLMTSSPAVAAAASSTPPQAGTHPDNTVTYVVHYDLPVKTPVATQARQAAGDVMLPRQKESKVRKRDRKAAAQAQKVGKSAELGDVARPESVNYVVTYDVSKIHRKKPSMEIAVREPAQQQQEVVMTSSQLVVDTADTAAESSEAAVMRWDELMLRDKDSASRLSGPVDSGVDVESPGSYVTEFPPHQPSQPLLPLQPAVSENRDYEIEPVTIPTLHLQDECIAAEAELVAVAASITSAAPHPDQTVVFIVHHPPSTRRLNTKTSHNNSKSKPRVETAPEEPGSRDQTTTYIVTHEITPNKSRKTTSGPTVQPEVQLETYEREPRGKLKVESEPEVVMTSGEVSVYRSEVKMRGEGRDEVTAGTGGVVGSSSNPETVIYVVHHDLLTDTRPAAASSPASVAATTTAADSAGCGECTVQTSGLLETDIDSAATVTTLQSAVPCAPAVTDNKMTSADSATAAGGRQDDAVQTVTYIVEYDEPLTAVTTGRHLLATPPSPPRPSQQQRVMMTPVDNDNTPTTTTTTTTTTTKLSHSHFVVVAIDFGTTFSGYAFSFSGSRSGGEVLEPGSVHVMRRWEGGDPGVVNHKAPTTLLLTPTAEFHSFGFTARDFYHDLSPRHAKKWFYFDKFKMILHHDTELNVKTEIAASNGQRVLAATVFIHVLRFFRKHAIQELSDQCRTKMTSDDVRWVITVPSIWREPAKQFMRQAAYQAGIASRDRPDQLVIALEPEAASIYVRRLHLHQLVPDTTTDDVTGLILRAPRPSPRSRLSLTPELTRAHPASATELTVINDILGQKLMDVRCWSFQRQESPVYNTSTVADQVDIPGTRYMVIDCGGGTVDITIHELSHTGALIELFKATGGPFGSTAVDEEFERLLVGIFGSEFIEVFKVKRPAGWVDLMMAFESRKRAASPLNTKPLNVSLPFSFIDYHKKFKNFPVETAIRCYGDSEVLWSSQGMLRLLPGAMKRLFQPTLDHITQAIGNVLNEPSVKGVKFLFLVGGFAESPVLQAAVRTEFQHLLKIIIPHEVSLAVLRGAVCFGVNPEVVTTRRCLATYGVGVIRRFMKGRDLECKLQRLNGEDWCMDVFDPLVHANQPIPLGHTVTRRYTPAATPPSSSSPYPYTFDIYTTDDEDVMYTTDPGVKHCGTLSLEFKGQRAGPDYPIGTLGTVPRAPEAKGAPKKEEGQQIVIVNMIQHFLPTKPMN